MKTIKISESEIASMKISSLPSRPTAPTAFGGRGYTAKDMKAAFDKLPLFIIKRFNTLIDDIESDGDDSIAAAIPSGIKEGHSVKDALSDVTDGSFSEYLKIADETLAEFAARCQRELAAIKEELAYLSACVASAAHSDTVSLETEE